jgi:hypothetical protein
MGKLKDFGKFCINECIRVKTISLSKNDFIAELNGFMYRYNYQRKHSALSY